MVEYVDDGSYSRGRTGPRPSAASVLRRPGSPAMATRADKAPGRKRRRAGESPAGSPSWIDTWMSPRFSAATPGSSSPRAICGATRLSRRSSEPITQRAGVPVASRGPRLCPRRTGRVEGPFPGMWHWGADPDPGGANEGGEHLPDGRALRQSPPPYCCAVVGSGLASPVGTPAVPSAKRWKAKSPLSSSISDPWTFCRLLRGPDRATCRCCPAHRSGADPSSVAGATPVRYPFNPTNSKRSSTSFVRFSHFSL